MVEPIVKMCSSGYLPRAYMVISLNNCSQSQSLRPQMHELVAAKLPTGQSGKQANKLLLFTVAAMPY